jgi:predicted RNA-binding Zn ribbon-like protein
VEWHASAQYRQEYLTSYADLVAWSQHAGILSDEQARDLLSQAERHPELAVAALARAITVREALHHLFVAVATGKVITEDDVAVLNAALADALAHLRLHAEGQGFAWTWEIAGAALDHMLWPILRSAAELLTSQRLGRVRECAGDPCGWLFLDTSKNGSRRWCDMAGCGNRAKARRHYTRQRTTGQRPPA